MVFDTIQMNNVLDRSAEAVRAFAEQNGIRLEMVHTNASVYADGDRLVQVIVNLVSNAVKFSPKGQTVTVAVSEIPNWIEVKVIDRGRGIPPKYKNLLFQRFQQVEASDARKKGGTGLGLAICKGIIEAHGGTIGVESEEGKGSVFWFKIPPSQAGAIPGGTAPQAAAAKPQQPAVAQAANPLGQPPNPLGQPPTPFAAAKPPLKPDEKMFG